MVKAGSLKDKRWGKKKKAKKVKKTVFVEQVIYKDNPEIKEKNAVLESKLATVKAECAKLKAKLKNLEDKKKTPTKTRNATKNNVSKPVRTQKQG